MESIAEGRRKCKPYIKNQPRRAGLALQGEGGEKRPRLGGGGGAYGSSKDCDICSNSPNSIASSLVDVSLLVYNNCAAVRPTASLKSASLILADRNLVL